jgi:hypothetical protein
VVITRHEALIRSDVALGSRVEVLVRSHRVPINGNAEMIGTLEAEISSLAAQIV